MAMDSRGSHKFPIMVILTFNINPIRRVAIPLFPSKSSSILVDGTTIHSNSHITRPLFIPLWLSLYTTDMVMVMVMV
eukprot:gene32312-41873_t